MEIDKDGVHVELGRSGNVGLFYTSTTHILAVFEDAARYAITHKHTQDAYETLKTYFGLPRCASIIFRPYISPLEGIGIGQKKPHRS